MTVKMGAEMEVMRMNKINFLVGDPKILRTFYSAPVQGLTTTPRCTLLFSVTEFRNS